MKRPSFSVLNLPVEAILEYEVARAGWTGFIAWPWLQDLASRFMAWRVKRIKARFEAVLARKAVYDRILNEQNR